MATWIIVGGALLVCLILGGALFVVLFATRERSGPVRVPGISRIVDSRPADTPPADTPPADTPPVGASPVDPERDVEPDTPGA